MPIIRNLKEDFLEGRMDNLRTVTYAESGTQDPFVTKDLENPPENRGLLLQVNKRVDDLTRISKLLINKPGLKFAANEALLKQSELTKKLEGNNKTKVGNIIRRVGGTVKHVAQVVGSTLAQVPVNGTGTHFVRGFRSDTYLQPFDQRSGFSQFFGAGGIEGSKYALAGKPVPHETNLDNSNLPFNTTKNPGDLSSFAVKSKSNIGIQGDFGDNFNTFRLDTNSEELPYYSKTDITNVNVSRKGVAFPETLNNFLQTTARPLTLGPDKTSTGAFVSGTGRVNSNPNLRFNKFNPRFNTEFYKKTEDTVNIVKVGKPVQRGKTVKVPSGLSNGGPLVDLFVPFLPITTAASGSFGISNKIGLNDPVENPVSGLTTKVSSIKPFAERTKANTKTKLFTNENILQTSISGRIPLDKAGIETTNTIAGSTNNKRDGGEISNLLTNKEPNDPSTTNKFSDSSSYISRFQSSPSSTLENINSVQQQNFVVGTDGVIPLRSIGGTGDPLQLRSFGLTDNFVLSGSYKGRVSSIDNSKSPGFLEDFRSKGQTANIPLSSTDFTGEVQREIKSYALDYTKNSIKKETRIGLGDQGSLSRKRTSYTELDNTGLTVDALNALDVQTSPLAGGTSPVLGASGSRDLIQLEFQVLTPEETYYLGFRAFLDTFDDSFNGAWSSHQYLGRADNFYTYSGFDRSINIGFKIAAATSQEMKPLYRKAATLASVTAPTYKDNGRFMRGTLARITVGDYIYEQPGIIESVQYTWQKDYPWEISFSNPEGGERSQILPHVLDISVSFKVIHDFLPEAGINPLITNHRPTGNKDTYITLGS